MTKLKYQVLHRFLKEKIQQGEIKTGEYLPSENELCVEFAVTRTTVRKAMDELLKEGFIEKKHGRGSQVCERRKSLGLLTVKGFSEAVGQNVNTIVLKRPMYTNWNPEIQLKLSHHDKQQNCLFFERLRMVNQIPVMIEKNWFPDIAIPGFTEMEFVEGSFFKTLSRNYFIEIIGSEHELRAELADSATAALLKIQKHAPVLHISVKFKTSNPLLTIYSELYCNTQNFPVGNSYML
jgi:GntR family transcriptional regulator/GntR family frlABCD operon transcriptional regulator